MPALENPKHEKFAQQLATCILSGEAVTGMTKPAKRGGMGEGFYVYALCRPDGTAFYIGKGKRDRAFQHLKPGAKANLSVAAEISSIRHFGEEPSVRVVLSDLKEWEALAFERKVIVRACAALCNKAMGVKTKRQSIRDWGAIRFKQAQIPFCEALRGWRAAKKRGNAPLDLTLEQYVSLHGALIKGLYQVANTPLDPKIPVDEITFKVGERGGLEHAS